MPDEKRFERAFPVAHDRVDVLCHAIAQHGRRAVGVGTVIEEGDADVPGRAAVVQDSPFRGPVRVDGRGCVAEPVQRNALDRGARAERQDVLKMPFAEEHVVRRPVQELDALQAMHSSAHAVPVR